jgi:predicted dehydrogenase
MVKVALVGVGKMGMSHYAILSAHPDVDVVAICDNAGYLTSTFRKQTGVNTYKDVNKMLEECDLDAIVVSTPNSTHYTIAKTALDRKLHIFMEKPLCLDARQSDELARLAAKNNLISQVGYHNRFIGTFQEMRRLVQSGAIGDVYHVEGKAFGQVVIRPKPGRTWRSKKSEGGGCLHDYACHVLDLMNFVAGPPEKVVSAQLQAIFSSDIEDAVYATLAYRSGATGLLEANWSDESVRKMSTTITAYGTNGKIITDRQELRVYMKPGSSFEQYNEGWTMRYITELQKPVNFYLRGEEYTSQLDQFISSIQGEKGGVVSSFESAAETDRIIDEIVSIGKAA